MRLIFIIISICISYFVNAQEFSTLLIPDSLLKGADVVKRYEEYVLTIKSPSSYTVKKHHVYTILNEAAKHYAKDATEYDKFKTINAVSGTLYNMMGKEIKKLKKKDWQDLSAPDGMSLMTDRRYKLNEFFYNEYPYTVEYEEEDEYNGIQEFDSWIPIDDYRMSVQFSRFIVIAPADYQIRYKQINFSELPQINQEGNAKTYLWEAKNLKAIREEMAAPFFQEIVPNIAFAPSQFEVEGYKGDMTTWEGYGKFMYQLIKGRDALPENIKKKVHELTDNLKTDKEKIFVLYDFLQKNTHYISIQLGIGGWQPFEASYVAEKKYGDCKALSNYMVALLKETGVKAKYVEIYGDNNPPPFMEDFPCSQSNHVISCVPMGKDTIWLECTNQTVSPGYMGRFTGNRKALIIDEDGGHVVNTPRYSAADNLQIRKIEATLDAEGLLDAGIKTHYTGVQQELPQALINEASKEEREKYLNDMFNLPTYEVVSSNYKEEKGIIPVVDEELHILAKNYASITGKRLFITPNIFGRGSGKLMVDSLRQYDYVMKNAYKDIDSAIIQIPAGYTPESLPKDISLQTKFGKYISSTKVTDDKIIYYRLREQYSGRFSPKEYNDLVKFYEQVYKADRAKVVLVKQE